MINKVPKIRFIIATRETKDGFFNNTLTGKTLNIYKFPFVEIKIYPENKLGLPKIYNKAIEDSKDDPAILIFTHDDIMILDYNWVDRILSSFNHFQILGLAGNIQRTNSQPSWYFIDENLTRDKFDNLSGIVGHGDTFPPKKISYYGVPFKEVKILDGLFLAVKSETLIKNNLKFDEIFDFHLWDVDFCRQAEEKKIKMGTIPLSIIHKSGGNYDDKWKVECKKYIDKWKSAQ